MALQGRLRRSTPVLLVDDIAATVRWYRANLGFKGDAVPARRSDAWLSYL